MDRQQSPAARRHLSSRPVVALLASAALLAACGTPLVAPSGRPSLGQDEAAVRAAFGSPTGRYSLPQGGSRLEYARGPQGTETWMVDLDAAGRVTAVEQVLTPRRFAELRRGMTADEVLRLLGRPAERQRQYLDRTTWYWRFTTYDCVWFGLTFSPQGRTIDTGGELPDPRCDVSQ